MKSTRMTCKWLLNHSEGYYNSINLIRQYDNGKDFF